MPLETWHVFTGIGSALGIVNTVFLIYDRLLRYRPIVSLGARRGLGGTSLSHATPTLNVKNIAPFHIVIERFNVSSNYYSVAPSSEVRGMAKVLMGADTPVLLAPAEERQLVIIQRGDAPPDEKIVIKLHWRGSGAASWLPHRPVLVRTSSADIKLRQEAAMNAERDPSA
jgi:hypothetical protein